LQVEKFQGEFRARSRRRSKVLANHPRMTGRDPQEADGRPLWLSSSLFPIAKRMHTDAHRLSELGLRKADEAPQGNDVVTGFNLSYEDGSVMVTVP
jgi:hypothetical protein